MTRSDRLAKELTSQKMKLEAIEKYHKKQAAEFDEKMALKDHEIAVKNAEVVVKEMEKDRWEEKYNDLRQFCNNRRDLDDQASVVLCARHSFDIHIYIYCFEDCGRG